MAFIREENVLNFLMLLARVISWLIDIVSILIVVRALLSWLPLGENNKLLYFLDVMTEPVVSPIRKLLNKSEALSQIPIDLAPLIALIILSLLGGFVMSFTL